MNSLEYLWLLVSHHYRQVRSERLMDLGHRAIFAVGAGVSSGSGILALAEGPTGPGLVATLVGCLTGLGTVYAIYSREQRQNRETDARIREAERLAAQERALVDDLRKDRDQWRCLVQSGSAPRIHVVPAEMRPPAAEAVVDTAEWMDKP